jgi:release factor glutamine methyltransferase
MEDQAIEATEAPLRAAEVLQRAARRLLAAGIENARLDAEILLGHVLYKSREQLVLLANRPVSRAQLRDYEQLLRRRVEREPVAYITGTREFWSMDFNLTRDVLIPRPETERVVEVALSLARATGDPGPLRIADLGTGSGAIAVALAKELPAAQILAVDLSAAALNLARRNAAKHGVSSRINFIRSDFFAAFGARRGFHLLVSNPPYVPSADIAKLEAEVSRWEPRDALNGGTDGLDCYRRMAAGACKCMAPNGAAVFEIGASMAREVIALFRSAGEWSDITLYQDYAGHDRVLAARRTQNA